MNTIAPQALLVTTAKDGVKRFHRPTCKRVNDTAVSVADLLEQGKVGGLAKATAASCCKPSAALVDAAQEAAAEEFAARITAWGSDAPVEAPEETETVVEDAEEAQEAPEEAAPAPAPTEAPVEAAAEPEEPQAKVVVTLAQSGMAKHYWRTFARQGGAYVEQALGDVTAKFTGSDVTLSGTDPERVELARVVLTQAWAEGYTRFNTWRKEDAVYKDTAAAEKGSHWFKSARAGLEQAWLVDFMRGVASTFADEADVNSGDTTEAYESGAEWASVAF